VKIAAWLTRRACRRRVQRGCRATRRRSTPILHDPGIAAVSFVGIDRRSPAYIYGPPARTGKRCRRSAGAKNQNSIVMPDADLRQARTRLMGAPKRLAGERCMAISWR